MNEYTLIFEFNTTTAWADHIPQLPELAKVRASSLSEVQSKLTKHLIDWLTNIPGSKDVLINSEVHYRLAQSSQQLGNN